METQIPPVLPQAGQPGVPAFQFPKSGEILKQSFSLYKQRFWTLIAISLVPVALFFVGGFLLGLIGITSANFSASSLNFAAILLFILCLVFGIYAYVWSFTALIHNLLDEQADPGFKMSFQTSSHDILPLIGTGLLAGLAVAGGLILFIIPGIIFAFWFSQTNYIVITEKLNGSAALKRSRFYVEGNIWQIFKKTFYFGLITIGIALLIGFAAGILDALARNQILSPIISNGFSIVWAPLTTVYNFLVFKNLRASKQALVSPQAP